MKMVPQQTCRVLEERFDLPCFASPFGACETVCLFLKTCAVQPVSAVWIEERWPYCMRSREGSMPGFGEDGKLFFQAGETDLF